MELVRVSVSYDLGGDDLKNTVIEKCTHEEWCNNSGAFTVFDKLVCSVHLASAIRFALDLNHNVFGDSSGVVVHHGGHVRQS